MLHLRPRSNSPLRGNNLGHPSPALCYFTYGVPAVLLTPDVLLLESHYSLSPQWRVPGLLVSGRVKKR